MEQAAQKLNGNCRTRTSLRVSVPIFFKKGATGKDIVDAITIRFISPFRAVGFPSLNSGKSQKCGRTVVLDNTGGDWSLCITPPGISRRVSYRRHRGRQRIIVPIEFSTTKASPSCAKACRLQERRSRAGGKSNHQETLQRWPAPGDRPKPIKTFFAMYCI